MAKKINVDEIDEQFIIASVRKEHVQPEITPPPLTPLPASVPVQPVQALQAETPVVPEQPQTENLSRREKQQKYESLFIRESDLPPARFGKSVYVRKEYHDRISQIISVIGINEVSIFGYIDNVLTHHFESFQDEMIQCFKKNSFFK
jgi:hypothetical protein